MGDIPRVDTGLWKTLISALSLQMKTQRSRCLPQPTTPLLLLLLRWE